MKFLIALTIAQTAFLGFLGVRVLEIDASVTASAATVSSAQMSEKRNGLSPSAPVIVKGPNAEEIREIIRQELAALSIDALAVAKQPSQPHASKVREDARSAADSARLQASLQQDLDYHIGRGRMQSSDLAALELKMARLPARERTQALRRLAKAMNSGDLEAQF